MIDTIRQNTKGPKVIMTPNITRDSPIEISLGVYTYSAQAGVVMTSIFEHTTSPVRIHILHVETLTSEDRAKLIRTAEKYNQQIEFHDVSECVKTLGPELVSLLNGKFAHWTIGTTFRLFVAEVIPADRVIHLDCDIIVRLDIRELWEIDMKGNCIAGVLNVNYKEKAKSFLNSKLIALMGWAGAEDINAGVLLMDLKRIRELPTSVIKAAPAWLLKYAKISIGLDEDFLKTFFCGSILTIPDKFNQMNQNYDNTGVILHMMYNTKPWNALIGLPREKLYWQTYLKSAWGENMTQDKLLDTIMSLALHNPQLHQHTSQCWRKIWNRLKIDIFHVNFFCKIFILIRFFVERAQCRLMQAFHRQQVER